MHSIKPKHTFRLVWIGLAIVITGLLLLGVGQLISMATKQAGGSTASPSAAAVAEPHIVSIESKLLFTGNSFWGRYTNDEAKKTDDPYAFPFSRLHEFDRKSYDAWVTGLECPTTVDGTTDDERRYGRDADVQL